MSELYAVLLSNSTGRVRVGYGPTSDKTLAEQFAAFLTAEVDPAYVVPLRDMTAELLSWRAALPDWQRQEREAAIARTLTWLFGHIRLTEEQLAALPAEVLAEIQSYAR